MVTKKQAQACNPLRLFYILLDLSFYTGPIPIKKRKVGPPLFRIVALDRPPYAVSSMTAVMRAREMRIVRVFQLLASW